MTPVDQAFGVAVTAPRVGGNDPARLGIGHSVGVDPRTGRASVRVPLSLTSGRAGFGPELALTHSPGAVGGAYGAGWQLDGLPTIEVSTRTGLPTYDSRDAYTFSA